MYLYLYDSFLNNPRYNNKLAKIETRLTDLGIGGKISRLSPLKNLKDLIDEEVKAGIKTVVAVGSDKTIAEIINVVANYKVVLGYIPIGPAGRIGEILGITDEDSACEIISARKIEKIDLGKINGHYFFGNLRISEGPVTIECEEKYNVQIQKLTCQINICNIKPAYLACASSANLFNPQDGLLETFIAAARPAKKIFGLFGKKFEDQASIFPCKKVTIKSKKSITVIADELKVLKTPARVEIAPKKMKVIVGKNRLF